jgi:hypothetical protein
MRKILIYTVGIIIGIVGSAISREFNSTLIQTLLLISAGSIAIIAPVLIVVTLPKVKKIE